MSTIEQQTLAAWKKREAIAEALVPLTGRLYRKQAVVSEVFGVSLVRKTPATVLQILDTAAKKAGQPIDVVDAATLLERMNGLELGRARIDLGKLILRFRESGAADLGDWAAAQLGGISRTDAPLPERPQDVVLYGFGRIGRLVARILIGLVANSQTAMISALGA